MTEQELSVLKKYLTPKQLERLLDIKAMNKSLSSFFGLCTTGDILNIPTRYAYEAYVNYCKEQNFQAVHIRQFSNEAKTYFRMKIIDKKIKGEKYRIFTHDEAVQDEAQVQNEVQDFGSR